MLSVLIPVYNFDVRALVNNLHRQLTASHIAFEIILLDDASGEAFCLLNKELVSLDYVIFESLPKNIGRHAIRHQMALRAVHDNLLYMDCDSSVTDDAFIHNYLHFREPGIILAGGRSYSDIRPTNPELLLHWHYGKKREQKKAAERNKDPYAGFMTNNFLISKKQMLEAPFISSLKGYGHEDTMLGLFFFNSQIKILHIDNPLQHDGLVKIPQFFEQTDEALQNLSFLYMHNREYASFFEDKVKLVKAYRQIKNLLYIIPFQFFLGDACKWMVIKTRMLFFLDAYKLFRFRKLCRNSKK